MLLPKQIFSPTKIKPENAQFGNAPSVMPHTIEDKKVFQGASAGHPDEFLEVIGLKLAQRGQ
jgi:hypothetical protein